jgi:hypothetical protein
LALVEEVRGEQERLADALTRLVRDYRFDTILALSEQVVGAG